MPYSVGLGLYKFTVTPIDVNKEPIIGYLTVFSNNSWSMFWPSDNSRWFGEGDLLQMVNEQSRLVLSQSNKDACMHDLRTFKDVIINDWANGLFKLGWHTLATITGSANIEGEGITSLEIKMENISNITRPERI